MDLAAFKAKLPSKRALIGFDYGSRRLGVAVSDPLLTVASSHAVIYRQNRAKDEEALRRIIEEKEIGGMVFGLPLQMNGEEGDMAAEVRAFAAEMEKIFALPVAFWDERLSSSAMENFLIKEADLSRAKRKKVLDASAAAYILQGFLDALTYV